MSGERINYSIERQRHEGFVGREALLDQLDELLTADGADRWVVVTGGPGMGKSALLAAWLARRERAGAVVPHHFIRRGQYDWDDPAKLVSSLVAQLEERHLGVREPEADERIHPAARLAAMLSRVLAAEPARPGARLVLLIDGLDEYDPPAGVAAIDPLAAFLPHALPRGVSFLCASRPKDPYLDRLAERDGELVQLDLNEQSFAADNEATVRAFWEQVAPGLGLDARFVDKVVARAGGNLQHAATLRKQLAAMPAAQRRPLDIPRGLGALLGKLWERVATDPIAVAGLGILCAAREALTLHELGAVAGWTDEAQQRSFLRGTRELLVETWRAEGVPEYRLHHDSIRAHIAGAVGAEAIRKHHDTLARRLATWPPPVDATARRYALQHALLHRAEAGAWTDAWRTAADMSFLEAKCREFGEHDAEADVARTADRCRASGDESLHGRLEDLARALRRESHWLRTAPEATAALVWNRLRCLGWSAAELDQRLQLPAKAVFLRLRHLATRESAGLVRDIVGHSGWVNSCAVTMDGRRAVSASDDTTLKIWDLESGRAVATLRGHAAPVTACAVTPDGKHAVSGSSDRTLKVWDLVTGMAIVTLQGHVARINACAVTPHRHVVSASDDNTLKVWDLESGNAVVTLQGHVARVNACAVTPDGRVVSASDDNTLKVWDLESGNTVATLRGHTARVNACAVTPDGTRAVSGSSDRTLKVWDLESGQVEATFVGHTGGVHACAVASDGCRVMSGSTDRTLKVWDLESGRALATLQGHAASVGTCAVTPDGRLVSASDDNTLKVWDLESGRAVVPMKGHDDSVRVCAVTPDAQRVITGSDDRTLKVWDLETGRAITSLQGHKVSEPDKVDVRSRIRIISEDVESKRSAAILEGRSDKVTACVVMPDGQRVVSASWDMLVVWNLETGRPEKSLRSHESLVRACAVTPDGRVISGSHDGTLKIWDLKRGRPVKTVPAHDNWVLACAVTPDGKHAISASSDKTLRVWELPRGRMVMTLHGHAASVNACTVTPDGKRAISASSDKTLKVWDLATKRAVATLHGHADSVLTCAVTPDGRRVVSGSWDNTIKVWSLESSECLFTHYSGAAISAVAATTSTIIAGDASGDVWFLDWPLPEHRNSSNRDDRRSEEQRNSSRDTKLPSPRPPMKHTILFLAANPLGTDRLALDREAREIQVELERSGFRDRFELVTRWAAEPLDLLRELRKLKPTVVHFSGHGGPDVTDEHRSGAAPRRDIVGGFGHNGGEPRHGLFFQAPDGRPQLVSTEALEETFGAAGSSVKLVVLNACYSDVQAQALASHVGCVVGMNGSVRDDAARSFAIGFYGGLGERESIAAAYKQGCAAISLQGLRDRDRPQLAVRAGVDASKLILAADSVEPSASRAAPAPASQPSRPGASTAAPPKVDIGILTIRDDEFRAVLDVFPSKAGIFKGVRTSREYTLRHTDAGNGERYTVAVLCQVEQGNGEAQNAARDLIEDFAPGLILVVGIAGAVPSDDVKLGDVVLSMRIHDFTVEAREADEDPTYSTAGGPIAKMLATAIANLPAREDELGDWRAALPVQPPVLWTQKGQIYGPPEWQNKLRTKLEHHYRADATPRAPIYAAGPIASSDRLVKDPAVLIPWLQTARKLLAVEMESGGVYRAAQERCPMLAIRGISDIVGLKRADAWTKYACASAAAFARAFLRTRPVPVSDPS